MNWTAKTNPPALFTTIFHEPWWLDAVAGGNWHEAAVTANGAVVARLPYIIKRHPGITGIGMPPLTHHLGPQLPLASTSSYRPSDHRRLMNELMRQLPRHDYFSQICDPGMQNALPLYALGYDSGLTYTLRIPVNASQEAIWQGMRQEMRRAIRKAEKAITIDRSLSIDEFCRFYNACVKTNNGLWWSRKFERRADQIKIRLYEACLARDAGCLLAARDESGVLRAAIMPVWGHGVMFYLLTAHDSHPSGAGSVKLLVWEALKMASAKGLSFDFDGFPRPSSVNFLTGFGGEVRNRIAITKASPLLHFIRALASRSRFGI